MHVKELSSTGTRRFVVALDPGEEALDCLLSFARDHDVRAGEISGLGAFEDVTLGFFDPERKDYDRIRLDEQVEVVSLVGNVATQTGEIKLHLHVVVARRDGRAFGGHLLEAKVRPTLEVMVTEAPPHLRREIDPATGLPLLAI